MATLLLRLAGPLQSWGVDSKFETRRTQPFPTKSGVIGMLAAALGISREDDEALKELNRLKFGVRVDKEGELLRDFHTAVGEKAYLTYRYYLSDAIFVAAVEGDDETVKKLEYALKNPAFPLFLGRRSCPPTMPVVLGVRSKELVTALQEEPWQVDETIHKNEDGKLRLITDGNAEDAMSVVRDVPVSFSKYHRKFIWRNVKEHKPVTVKPEKQNFEHDPFTELG